MLDERVHRSIRENIQDCLTRKVLFNDVSHIADLVSVHSELQSEDHQPYAHQMGQFLSKAKGGEVVALHPSELRKMNQILTNK